MNRLGALPHAALAALLLGSAAACSKEADAGPYRHVVLVSLDTTRADHLGCYGAERDLTPFLDRLAERAVVFEDVTAPAPTTLTSHTSLMTGTWPHTHGVVRNGFVVHEDNVLMAELLAASGFHTAAFLGSFALESRFGFAQGFALFDEDFDVLVSPDTGHDQNQRRASDVTDAVLRHVDELEDANERRLFLFVHYFDAHQPYDPPPPFDRRWTEDGEPDRSTSADVGRAVLAQQRRAIGSEPGVGAVIRDGLSADLARAVGEPRRLDRRLADLYAGEVTYMDAELGRLLDGLTERGLLEESLVIVTADHGETFWEHGDFWNHGLWVYRTTTQVPLILRLPDGRGAGRRVGQPVSGVDVLPTVCELLGIDAPPRVEGTSLVPAIDGRAFERGPVFSQATQPGPRVEPPGRWGNLQKPRSVQAGVWKYVQAPYLETEQLFRLDRDPNEASDLLSDPEPSEEVRDERARLAEELERWVRTQPELPSEENRVQIEETLERLQQLGYVEGSSEDEE